MMPINSASLPPAQTPSSSELIPPTHRVTLWGAPESCHFPPLCANCGAAALNRIAYSKAFRRSSGSDTPDRHAVISVSVPFCDECIARHQSETSPKSLLATLTSGFTKGEMLGAVFFAAAALFCAFHAVDELVHLRLSSSAIFALLASVFAWIARVQQRQAWAETEHLRVLSQSSVTTAFDFTDSIGPEFESARFKCSMRDPSFAAAFSKLNEQNNFSASSPRAVADRRSGRRQMWAVAAGAAVIGAFLLSFGKRTKR